MFSSESMAEWSEEHFSSAAFSDVRRVERLKRLAAAFKAQPGRSIPALFERPYDITAAYRFLNHPEATPENIQAGHRQVVLEGLHEPGTYLLIEDGSDFSWSGNLPIAGLGPVGSGAQGLQGFALHTILALEWPADWEEHPAQRRPTLKALGVADQQFYVRPPKLGKKRERAETLESLETHLWEMATEHLGKAPDNRSVRWVRVCDSGADIYELLSSCQAHHHGFVVRACKDRVLVDEDGQPHGHLFERLRQAPAMGAFSLALRARPGQAARTATFSVASLPVILRSPQRPGHGPGKLPSIACTAIRVWEADPPGDVEALEWLLLTDVLVARYQQARECVLQYASRWLVEEFHKALKSGMAAERLQMESAHALFAAISIMSVVALELIDFRERLRLLPDAPAEESGLPELELQLLAARLDRKLTTMRDIALAIGRLGGHMNRKSDGMPGWQTLWQGWRELKAMADGARLILQMKIFDQ